MRKPSWSCLLFGLMLATLIACKPISEDEQEQPTAEQPTATTDVPIESLGEQAATVPIPTKPLATSAPPPAPTAVPTSAAYAGWQQIGNPATGLQLMAPPSWFNLSGQVDTAVAANELGITVLLLADSQRTGDGLLGNKNIGDGAYVAGLITHLDFPPNTPQATLNRLATDLTSQAERTIIAQATTVNATVGSGGMVTGSYLDLVGTPLLFSASGTNVRTRIYLFSTALGGNLSQQTQALFIMSSADGQWPLYEATFEKMANSIILHNIYADIVIQDGSANVLGSLGQQDLVNGELSEGVKDVWTFSLPGSRYANITLSPDNKDIDLILSLISPTGQTVTRIDNGYAGDTEIMIDNLLQDSGLYVVEVSEFFGDTGRYTMSLVLTEEPLFGGGGRLSPGQTIQSTLARGAQHIWTFTGNAQEVISIVLTPENQFDAILDIYGPDGSRLAALDEGFSGDAEVVAALELPLTGEYDILVRSFAGEGGGYSLSLDEGGDRTSNFYDAGDLIAGQIAQETLRANEAHAWFFTGHAGDEIFITVNPLTPDLDLDVWLLDANVARLAEEDSFLAGESETINYTLPEDSQYLVLVRDFFGEPGQYEIDLQVNQATPPEEAGTLDFGTAVSDTLQPYQMVVWYFEAEDGDEIDIELTPGNDSADLLFTVYDPSGNQIWSIDAAQAGEGEAVNAYPVMIEGRWSIVVREFFGEATSYTLEINEN
ncbi:PPC domain-containing protein [Candidatus Leptofilum sp.]|uniref:PPC domain-containing protein n=1 Tax=Candidatus Leptofilum sp. TaxID=3241576 RepID=UPI003B5A3060